MLSNTEPAFRLTTLGGLSITAADGAATGLSTRRRALALLALAGSGRDGLSRDRVMALLWPELDSACARNNLKQTVFGIRRTLGVDALDRSTSNVTLDRRVIAVDAHTFEHAIDANALEEAAECYAGPFLDGFYVPHVSEFDRWVERVRARLAWSHARALEILVVNARARGDAASAVQWGRRLTEHDPLSTSYALSLISALGDAGEPLKALDHARMYTKLIREEFGCEPDQRIAMAAERVRESLVYLVAAPQSPSPASALASSFPPVFVERDAARPARHNGPVRSVENDLH
jgi:DNA-binding SARP family transcriptional activator